jgi:hypothetical protein
VDDLVVNTELLALVIDDKDADASSAIIERLGQTLKEAALVKNGKALLDVASLCHGNDAAILTDIENAVLLEDRSEHVLDDNGRGRVRDEARLLMELLGEEVNTKIAVLASLRRGGDADDLARTTLKDQEIANADVVARDGDGIGRSHGARCGVDLLGRDARGNTGLRGGLRGGWSRNGGRGVFFLHYDFVAVVTVGGARVRVRVRVVVTLTVDRVEDTVGGFVKTVTEGMILAVFVVISHITLVLLGGVDGCPSSLVYSNLFSSGIASVDDVNLAPLRRVGVVLGCVGLLGEEGGLLVVGLGAEVRVTLFSSVTACDGTGMFAVLMLRDVDLGRSVVRGRAADSVEVFVVGPVLDVDMASHVAVVGLLVAVTGLELNLDAFLSLLGLLGLLGLLEVVLFVDADFLTAGRAAVAVFFVDTHFLLVAGVAVVGTAVGRADGGREGFVVLFVTFPSDVRSLRR